MNTNITIIAVYCMLQAVFGIIYNLLCILMYACTYDLPNSVDTTSWSYFQELYLLRMGGDDCSSVSIAEQLGFETWRVSALGIMIIMIIYILVNFMWGGASLLLMLSQKHLKNSTPLIIFLGTMCIVFMLDLASFGAVIPDVFDAPEGGDLVRVAVFLPIMFIRGLVFFVINVSCFVYVLLHYRKGSRNRKRQRSVIPKRDDSLPETRTEIPAITPAKSLGQQMYEDNKSMSSGELKDNFDDQNEYPNLVRHQRPWSYLDTEGRRRISNQGVDNQGFVGDGHSGHRHQKSRRDSSNALEGRHLKHHDSILSAPPVSRSKHEPQWDTDDPVPILKPHKIRRPPDPPIDY